MTDEPILAGLVPPYRKPEPSSLSRELTSLLNYHSQEQFSDTPDYILAEYLMDCLRAYNAALQKRENWYGRPIRVKGEQQ